MRRVIGAPLLGYVLAGLVGFRLVLAALLPLSPDEAYYWMWSQHLQTSYMDHPFMVALWIRLGTVLFGDVPFGVRFCGVLASLGASLALYGAARRLWPQDTSIAERSVYLLNVTLMFGLGMVVTTPDTPLMFFVAVSLWAFAAALTAQPKKKSLLWWGGTGLSLGCAGDSKYTAFLLGVGLAGFVLTSSRRLWRQPGPWVGLVIAMGATFPVWWWNAHHHWVSFLKQGGRAGDWHPERAGQFLGELIGGQIGLATPVVFLCGVVGLWQARRKSPLLLWLSLPACCLFLVHACGDRVQANWPSVIYPVFALAGGLSGFYWRTAIASGAALSLTICGQAAWRPVPLSAHWDPILRQTAGWDSFAEGVRHLAEKDSTHIIAVEDYALASILSFHLHRSESTVRVIGEDQRWVYLQKLPRLTIPQPALCLEEERKQSTEGSLIIWRMTEHGRKVRAYRIYTCHAVGAVLSDTQR
ncbi:phospholipid carrier-dependent glycosyltransferase [Saccharibacter sp. 17.LH.SD]|uniref:ArnT family glycosyltransferase n=1 Tax=Saccharibacter sp. 17.LH.SD TaxID=2689393 RepID=UPI00136C378C|nr:glycosyltransferase family 39 protein [Saccharibacter sp. 17.LH.SD]MXV44633.1 phospholipid carrier-dependent glycosyltransferase [Saccharibacter sp. 17.LH.SD]